MKSEIRNQKSERTRQAQAGHSVRSGFRFRVSGFVLSIVFLLTVSLLSAQTLTPVAPPPAPVVAPVEAAVDTVSADSLAARHVPRADTAKVVMHHFNHRQQIITGSSIMAGLLAIMAVMNNYNPRAPL